MIKKCVDIIKVKHVFTVLFILNCSVRSGIARRGLKATSCYYPIDEGAASVSSLSQLAFLILSIII